MKKSQNIQEEKAGKSGRSKKSGSRGLSRPAVRGRPEYSGSQRKKRQVEDGNYNEFTVSDS